MDWTQVFGDVAAKIGTSAVIVGALALIGKIAVQSFFKAGVEEFTAELKHKSETELETLKLDLKRKNDLELADVKHDFELSLEQQKQRAELQKATFLQSLETDAAAHERIRVEILKWANPILNSVRDLNGRLTNIIAEQGYLALDEETASHNPNWAVSYSYFVSSTLYLFGQYFCWVHMLEQRLNFELFRSHAEKDCFFSAIRRASEALASYPPEHKGSGNDVQIFRLQQRAIAETLTTANGEEKGCMGYAQFLTDCHANISPVLEPLRLLIDRIKPGERRWNRLKATREALAGVQEECERVLDLNTDRP